MARRSSFGSLINQIAREHARMARLQEAQKREIQRNYERTQRETARLKTLADKEAKQRYLESRIEETEEKNKELLERNSELGRILEHTLHVDDTIQFDSLRIKEIFKSFEIPPDLKIPPKAPQFEDYLSTIKKPTALEKLIPGAEGRYQRAILEIKTKFNEDKNKYDIIIADRKIKIQKLNDTYDKEKQAFNFKVQQRNSEVDEFEKAYRNGDPDAVSSYCTMVLERSEYPEGFPQEFRIAYLPEPKELVIEYELPTKDILPKVSEYRYTKSKDSLDEKLRKATEIKEQYQDIVASICIRTIHEVFEADQNNNLLIVAFNGFVQTIDPSTGQDIRPCLISVRTTKERFSEINLSRIDKRACLRNLGAQISPRPDEMLAVKPFVEFDMVDKRFVEQSDILSDLENRPNLMDLNPFEFENLVSNLFEQIGFQAKLTRSSKDGGVDAVAFDPRPILGGKVVIQAKRYKNVVGVSAVRDLYGTMINEGANKGILVATSHYGPDAYDFSKDKPIELIDGSGLLYLLEQQGIKARIILPTD
ncbi:MAG TPA: restriction endonuclease [bacterium]|nr:restriction endonuclease [bacterium]HPN42189.1 restriction endonuclease [bacterium]